MKPASSSFEMGDLTFTHFGMYVLNPSKLATFYRQALGFTQTDAGVLRQAEIVFLSRDPDEHHQIVLLGGRPDPLPFNVINQISLKVPDLPALRKYHGRLVAAGASDVEATTHGNSVSIYCRDPEGNRLELYTNTEWYCEQPLREPIDFAQSDGEILSQVHALASRSPRFQPRAAWRAAMAARMAADQAD